MMRLFSRRLERSLLPGALKGILSGTFMSEYETYISDQFAGKVGWTRLRASIEQWQGKKETNGVFLAKDDYLLEKFTDKGQAFNKNLLYMKEFAKKDPLRTISFMLVPTSVEFYQEKLPLFAQVPSQKTIVEEARQFLADNIQSIPIYSSLAEHKKEEIYFRTDHHWTMRGAYYAYETAAETLRFEPYSMEDFTSQGVSSNFLGTYASKAVGFPIVADTIEVFQPRFPVSYRVKYEDTGVVAQTLYHKESLRKRDQYSFFLEGNHSLLTIQSQVKNGRKLAVIKDSYAHALLPFLANHYEEIHVIDLRYFHTGLQAYLEKNNLKDILFLYNVSNFMVDSNFIWLKS